MRHVADRSPLYPGVIFRQGNSQGAMWRGECHYFGTYGEAEAYLITRKAGKDHHAGLEAARLVSAALIQSTGASPGSGGDGGVEVGA